MRIEDVARNIEDINVSEILAINTPFLKKINPDKLKEKVKNAFSGYDFNGSKQVSFKMDGFAKWDFVAKVDLCNAPEIRIYLCSGEKLKTEIYSLA